MAFIVAFDTDKIKQYIFATNKLKEIRGASAILDELNEYETLNLLPKGKGNYDFDRNENVWKWNGKDMKTDDLEWEVIFVGGGSGMVVFKNKNTATKFCSDLEKRYYTFSEGGASITTAIIETDDLTNFQLLYQRLQFKLRQNKDARYQISQTLTHPFFRYCDSDGNLYAEKTDGKIAFRDEYFLSAQIRRKREYAKKGRVIFKKFIQFLLNDKNQNFSNWRYLESNLNKIFKNFENVISSKNGYKDIPNSFPDDITDLEDDRGYIGLIYADANRMGERLEQIKSKEAYSYFSKTIKYCNETAIFNALANYIKPKIISTNKGYKIELIPFEIFLLGGDDIILAVPGTCALEIARSYLDNFKNFTANNLSGYTKGNDFNNPFFGNGISMSAGVVFAHGNYPLHLLLKYATELQKSAKWKSREMQKQSNKNGEEVNCIDFEIIKQSLLPDIKSIRQTFEDKFTGKSLNLYKRPYTTEEMNELISEIHCWKKNSFPKNKLNEMYDLLHKGRMQAQVGFLRILRRLPEEIQKHLIHNYVMKNIFPWEKNEAGQYTTPFFDLIEVYEFISE
ncbi:MAG: hypothetical protein GXO78_06920 [Calditrichaeota bacterium]|nr:hypothetical protein [Calditrichota bacterium]